VEVYTLLCLVNVKENIFYLFKSMLMISSLDLLIKVCLENF